VKKTEKRSKRDLSGNPNEQAHPVVNMTFHAGEWTRISCYSTNRSDSTQLRETSVQSVREHQSPRGMKRRRSIAIFALQTCRGEPNSKPMTTSSNFSIVECAGTAKLFVSSHSLIAGERLEIDLLLAPYNTGCTLPKLHLRCRAQVVRVDSSCQGRGFGIACRIESYNIRFGDADRRRTRIFKSAKA
jgi:hypothetical protein